MLAHQASAGKVVRCSMGEAMAIRGAAAEREKNQTQMQVDARGCTQIGPVPLARQRQ